MAVKVTIIGATYSGNKGAAGMLTAVIDSLGNQLPGTEFNILSLYPEKDELLKQTGVRIVSLKAVSVVFILPVVSFFYAVAGWFSPFGNILRRYPPLDVLVQADVLLDLSGISFVDGRTATLVYNVCCILPAFFVKTQVLKMSQALGPFRKFPNRLFAKALLPRVNTVYSRGKSTSENLKDLGLTNWKPAADLAFLLGEESGTAHFDASLPDCNGLTIGVSPSQVLSKYCSKVGVKYIESLAVVLNSVAKTSDARIVILAHSNLGANVVSRNNDYQVCSKLFELCEKNSTTLILEDKSPAELRHIIRKCDVFLASRFHSMISALCTETPTLVTSWSHKYREVMEEFEAEQWILNAEDISEISLTKLLNHLILNREVIARKIRENLPAVKASAQIQIDDVAAMLPGNQK